MMSNKRNSFDINGDRPAIWLVFRRPGWCEFECRRRWCWWKRCLTSDQLASQEGKTYRRRNRRPEQKYDLIESPSWLLVFRKISFKYAMSIYQFIKWNPCVLDKNFYLIEFTFTCALVFFVKEVICLWRYFRGPMKLPYLT